MFSPQPIDNSILISAPEEDVLELDEVGSEVSVDEDAVPERKVMINNRVRQAGLDQASFDWIALADPLTACHAHLDRPD
jgi:hypothetical protein